MNPFAGLGGWVGGCVALGAVARVVRFFDGRSLWNDEAQLALNIWGRDALALLAPLDFGQSAPYGFLLLERLTVLGFGPGELALRGVSLFAGLLALPAFAWVALSVLSRRGAQVAVVLFATSEPLIFYASELKPYALDVAVAIGLLALFCRLEAGTLSVRRAWCLAIAGAVAPWCSFPAVFALAAAGVWLFASAVRSPGGAAQAVVPRLGVVSAWAVSSALLFWLQVQSAMGEPYLREFWSAGFAPWPPVGLEAWTWYARTLSGFFADPLGLPPWWLSLAFGVLGIWQLGQRSRVAVWWLLGPLAFGLVASFLELYPLQTDPPVELSARLYPFVGRLWLFAVPAALLLVGEGIAAFGSRAPVSPRLVTVLLTVAVAGLSLRQFVINTLEPPVVQEFRPVAQSLGQNAAAEDSIWVHKGSEPTFEYYARRLGLQVRARNVAGGSPEDLAVLDRALAEWSAPGRVWFVSLDHPAWQLGDSFAAVTAGLGAVAEVEAVFEAPGAIAVGYRLRSPAENDATASD